MSDMIKDDILTILSKGFMQTEKIENPVIKAFRKGTCSGCNYNVDKTCIVCKCILSVKIESYTNRTLNSLGLPLGPIEKTHCPKGKWNDLDTANYYRAKKGKTLIAPEIE